MQILRACGLLSLSSKSENYLPSQLYPLLPDLNNRENGKAVRGYLESEGVSMTSRAQQAQAGARSFRGEVQLHRTVEIAPDRSDPCMTPSADYAISTPLRYGGLVLSYRRGKRLAKNLVQHLCSTVHLT